MLRTPGPDAVSAAPPVAAEPVAGRPTHGAPRPATAGKFLTVGGERFVVRGVSYGTFRPDPDGVPYPAPDVVERDLAMMAGHGFTTVRTYTVPPRWVLDLAHAAGLMVMVGLAWEQHVAFLDRDATAEAIVDRVRADVRTTAGHPAVLCYAVGNEIPAPIVRWHGPRRVERFLRRLCDVVRREDPGALVTYGNYPTTEYLDLGFLDLVCFNVYLEDDRALQDYAARLHTIAGDRPLVLTEVGLDSLRHGEQAQASSVAGQVRTARRAGCAGAVVFSWTDEWYRPHLGPDGQHAGGTDVVDWAFGLTDRQRRPKAALPAVAEAFRDPPALPLVPPRVSIVVCSLNGAATLADCLAGCTTQDYPDVEVIVVDDGSTDETAAIAEAFDVTVVRTPNRGLSSARNTGLAVATGEVIAYTDDDARPDPQWLRYLVVGLTDGDHDAVGGPNIPPPDGLVAHCVAHAPGGPLHVLVSDTEAEHIPGCNMAFRRDALERLGGFDPRFRTAGDDVDLCWRLRDAGGTIGFHAGAMVWHHRRRSVRTYLRQQRGYGHAEALLEAKWPDRYNAAGHLAWAGRLYGGGLVRALSRRTTRIYHGPWGTAPFQPAHVRPPGVLASLPQAPESYLVAVVLGVLGTLALVWPPAIAFVALLGLLVAAWVVQAARSAAPAAARPGSRRPTTAWALTTVLHLVQPVARLRGRARAGLTPWRRRGRAHPTVRLRARGAAVTRQVRAVDERLREVQAALSRSGAVVLSGGPFDRWDLAVRGGVLGRARVLVALEEHGPGLQVVRHRWWPEVSPVAIAAVGALGALAAIAAFDHAAAAARVLALLALVVAGGTFWQLAHAAGQVRAALERLETRRPDPTEPAP